MRSGELPFDKTVDLADAARAVVASLERPANELRLAAAPEALPWSRANRLLVEWLPANLVDNALRHGKPPVILTLVARDGQAWIDVEDAGEGMAPQWVDRQQEAFTCGNSSHAGPGPGQGPAIVRQVAARLGGAVSFERNDGCGSRWPGEAQAQRTIARQSADPAGKPRHGPHRTTHPGPR